MKKRVYQIDLFRFFAAFFVVVFHYTFAAFNAKEKTLFIDYQGFEFFSKYGYLGVDLFFMISGFVIILSTRDNSVIKFIKSRIIRLYPAYWISVIITFLFIYFFGGSIFKATVDQFLANLTMLHRFFRVQDIDGVYWSLFVELKFYFIVVVYLLLRRNNKITLDKFIFSFLVLSILPVFIDFSSFVILKIINSVFILKFSSYFIAGMLLYRIYTEGIKAKYIIGVLFCLALSLYYAINRITYLESYYSSNFSYIIISGIVFTFYLLMYLVSVNKLNFLNKKFFLKLGILTYSLYLVHQVVGIIMLNSLKDYMDKNLLLLLIIILMFLVSYLINLLVEKPLSKKMKLKLDIIIKNKL